MKSEFFGFRLPEDLKLYLQSQAQRQRTSMGHYIVMLILNDMKTIDTEKKTTTQGTIERICEGGNANAISGQCSNNVRI